MIMGDITICPEDNSKVKYSRRPVVKSDNYTNNLNIIYLNIQSIRNKLFELEALINSYDFEVHIVVLTEHWLVENENSHYNIDSYDAYFVNREKGYGGCAVYVKKTLGSDFIFKEDFFLSNFLVIKLNKLNSHVIVTYRSHYTELDQYIDKVDSLIGRYKNSFVLGDMNIDLLDENNHHKINYLNMLISNGYLNLNKISLEYVTRFASKTILDHFCTDILRPTYFFHVLDTALSDHRMFFLSSNLKPQYEEAVITKTVLDYDQMSIDTIWNEIGNFQTIDTLSNAMTDLITRNTKVIPIKKYKKKHEWMTSEIAETIKTRDYFYKYKQKYPNDENIKSLFDFHKKKLKKLIFDAKANFCSDTIEKDPGNPKTLWSVYKRLMSNSNTSCGKNSIKEIDHNNINYKDETDIANILNEFFVNVTDGLNIPTTNSQTSHIQNSPKNIYTKFSLSPTDTNEIASIINELKGSAATGYDGVSSKFVKKFSNKLSPVLSKLINQSFQTGTFPDSLKKAVITPIFKSGSKTNPTNYRPISVLSVFSKIIETVIKKRLSIFLQNNNVLHSEQYGFEKHSNTSAACMALTDFISKSTDKGKYTACVFIDLRKAFDCVNFEILLEKLNQLQLLQNEIAFFRSYLTDREQSVKIGNKRSSWRKIKKGVQQGSIPGPDLFKLYIDDLARIPLKGRIQLYADDAVIKYAENDENLLRTAILDDLKLIDLWLHENELLMNLGKTKILLFDNKKFQNKIFIHNNVEIEVVNHYNYLGLIIDKALKWQTHIQHIVKKITPYVFLLRRLRKFLNPNQLFMIYSSYILSHVIYLNPIWSNAAQTHLKKIDILLKKSIKFINNFPRLHPTNLLYSERYLSFKNICRYELYMTAFKILNNLIKHNFIINRNFEIHNYNTRNKANYYLSFFRTESQKKNVLYNCLKIYNNLPGDISNINNIVIFKKKIKQYIIENE
jgi:hypothetical protein